MEEKEEKEIKDKKVKKQTSDKKTVKKDVTKKAEVKKTKTEKPKVDDKKDKDEIKEVREVKPIKVERKQDKEEVKEKTKEKKQTNFSTIEVIVIIIITGLIVSVCSALIVYNNYDKFKINSTLTTKDELNEFIESYDHILNSYVKDVDKNKLIEAAIKGMYNYLNDEYSIYIDEGTNETLQERLKGKYEGVGIEITNNEKGEIYITRIFANSPAEKAGLKVNDIITELDGESLEGKNQTYLSNKIKTSDKEKFTVTYIRDGKEGKVEVERKEIVIDSVTSKVIDGNAYVKVETFSATTATLIEEKILALDENVKNIIIDLRDNTGGYLSAGYNTACLFTGKDKVVYQLKDKNGKIKKETCNTKPIREFEKVIVLVNNTTASASEIVTACLKENNNATVVGVTTFGKGTVQDTEQLKSGAMVKYTSSYWLTPKGNSINEVGIEPDVVIPPDRNSEEDVQLNKALELLK